MQSTHPADGRRWPSSGAARLLLIPSDLISTRVRREATQFAVAATDRNEVTRRLVRLVEGTANCVLALAATKFERNEIS